MGVGIYPNIDAERARNGMTVERLTSELGVNRRTYYSWLSKGRIPQKQLEKIADLFNVSVGYLLGDPTYTQTDRR